MEPLHAPTVTLNQCNIIPTVYHATAPDTNGQCTLSIQATVMGDIATLRINTVSFTGDSHVVQCLDISGLPPVAIESRDVILVTVDGVTQTSLATVFAPENDPTLVSIVIPSSEQEYAAFPIKATCTIHSFIISYHQGVALL